MILVWRICESCSRRFSQWHQPGGTQPMKALCQDCSHG